MPESDFPELEGFSMDLSQPMLPPSEVRRRGDRQRRRRTAAVAGGGVLAVALAIGAPVLATSGGDERGIQPAPSPTGTRTPDAATDWVTTVPAEFPLAAGFPTPYDAPERPDGSELTPTCGPWFSGDLADQAVLTYTGESEDRGQRWLILFADEDDARASLQQARDSVAACPADGVSGPPGSGTAQVYDEVDVDLGTDESFAWTQRVRHDDGLLSDLTLVQVARTGNALYVDSSYGSAADDDTVAFQSEHLQERSTAPLQSMCLFAEHPCSIESEAATDPATDAAADPPAGSAIPDDFALDQGMTADSETTVDGPGRDVDGVSFEDLCQTGAWPGAGTADRLAVHETGIEYGRTRELVTYGSADEAVAAMTALSAAVDGCPESEDRLFQSFDADTGYESSLTFGFTYREGIGGTLFQVVRVGRAILATSASGDFLADSLGSGVPGETADNAEITALMCTWTEAGC